MPPVGRSTPRVEAARAILRSLTVPVPPSGHALNLSQPSRPQPQSIGVSLSGGGYRATLFGLGALWAIVDGRVGDRVHWVASVSGGSLASALAASSGALATGSVTFESLVRRAIASAAAGGKNITKAGIERSWLGSARRGVYLRDLCVRTTTQHVFIAVDLLTRQPAFFSPSFFFSEGLRDEDRTWGTPGRLTAKEVVRGSAGFPGLPPVRLGPERFDCGRQSQRPAHGMALSDGGLWNNLATTWDSDRPRIATILSPDIKLPAHLRHPVDLHIAVDASTPVRRSRLASLYRPPGLNILFATVGQGSTLYQSTIYAHRRLMPAKAATVTFEDNPEYIDPVACHYIGGTRKIWSEVSELCEQVRTVLPTLRGLDPVISALLIVYAYALTSAHLAQHGVDNGRFRATGIIAEALL